jgi:toxin secretion/phage lysis holin
MEFIKYMVPVRIETIWGTVAGAFGLLTAQLFGEYTSALNTLLMLMVLDYASGVLAAYINPGLALNSQKGFKGIARKLFIFILVTVAYSIDSHLGTHEICTMTTFFYIANEGLSIIENAAKAGVPIPATLRNTLEQLSHEKKAREKKEDK